MVNTSLRRDTVNIDEPNEDVYMSGYPVLWIVTPRGETDFLRKNIGNQTVVQMEGEIGRDGW